ncbi:MAG: glutamate synthase subunit beta [Erysipelotrichaceae bacterium]|nr:glutamate synthase subunit beta [Erysipelotrichaceae bacterium]
MGKPDGFLLYSRREDSERACAERINDYDEIRLCSKTEERRKQASRCMNCGVPYCQSAIRLSGMVTGCPLHNLIPEWNDQIYRGNDEHALRRLLKTNPFPEFTGRVCPALCEKACINGYDGEPVTVRDNERFLSDTGFANNLIRAEEIPVRTAKKAAVIGSGPAGLAVAYRLNQRGHHVTVYERSGKPGGLLMYGIPNMKLDKKVVERRISLMAEEGIRFITGVSAGKDISLAELQEEYDAVILACGASQARMPDLEGIENTKGVIRAITYLSETTRSLPGLPEISAAGRNVVILGGGDTGNDCLATAIRQKCTSAVQIEMMPSPPKERRENNPWPEWPKVLKTDYGQEEAICLYGNDPRIWSTTLTNLITEDGALKAVETAKIHFEEGRPVISEERDILPCDLLIIAAGFTGCETELPLSAGIELSRRNTVASKENSYASNISGIFSCGDMHRGASLVVWAIREGLECAVEVDEWLMGYTNLI